MPDPDVLAIQRDYPLVFLACHVEHVRASRNAQAISARESGLLAHLDVRWPQTAGELAAHLAVSPSALSASIRKLVALGYVERRERAGDRRHAELLLTPRGVEALQGGSVLDTARLTALLGLLAPAERRAACRGLALLAGAAKRLNQEQGRAQAVKRRQRRAEQRQRRRKT